MMSTLVFSTSTKHIMVSLAQKRRGVWKSRLRCWRLPVTGQWPSSCRRFCASAQNVRSPLFLLLYTNTSL